MELELYPLLLRLLRHTTPNTDNGAAWNGQSWNSIVGGYGAAALGIVPQHVNFASNCNVRFFVSLQLVVTGTSLRRRNRPRAATLPTLRPSAS